MAKKSRKTIAHPGGSRGGCGACSACQQGYHLPGRAYAVSAHASMGTGACVCGFGYYIAIIFNLLFAEPLTAAISYAEAGMSAMPAGQLLYCVCGLIAGPVVIFGEHSDGALQACVGSSGHRRNTVHRLRIPWVERHEQAEGAVQHACYRRPRQGSRLGTAQASGYLRHNRRTHRGNM